MVAAVVSSALAGGAAGFLVARRGRRRLAWGLAAALLVAALALGLRGDALPGYEGLGHIIIAVLVLAPGGLGVGLGTVLRAGRRP